MEFNGIGAQNISKMAKNSLMRSYITFKAATEEEQEWHSDEIMNKSLLSNPGGTQTLLSQLPVKSIGPKRKVTRGTNS